MTQQQRVVLVTGGAKGIGRGIARAFLADGDTVVTCGRRPVDGLPTVDGNTASFSACDVRDAESVDALIALVVAEHGRLDVVVNNAGGTPYALVEDASTSYLEKIIALNLTAPLLVAKAANAVMQAQATGGVIVNIASVSGARPSPGTAAYGAAKAGLINLTQTLAVEWAPKVRVNTVTPGLIRTEQAHLHYGDEAGIAKVAATVPLGRLGLPEDIGEACRWLASDGAAYVSGADLTIHGGGERPAFLDAANADN